MVGQLVHQIEKLIDVLLKEPSTTLGDVEILSEEEKHKQLVEWNNTEHEVSNRAVFEAIEGNAENAPNAKAVRFNDTDLTYGALNARAETEDVS